MGPEDKNNCAYKIILMFGIGFLLPWQCMLSSLDYLMIEVRALSMITFVLQMQGYSPSTVYPFAVKGLLVLSELWVIVYGHK